MGGIMPVRYPLTVLAIGFSMDSLRYSSFTTRGLASKNSLFAPKDPFRVGPWFLPPSKEWQAMHPSEVYNFSPISRLVLMTTFGSSDDNLSPAFGRISILNLPGFFFDLFNLGIRRFKIQIFIGSGSEIKPENLGGGVGFHLYGY